jgi:hypothetical protein
MFSKMETHRAEASTYAKLARQSRAKFQSTGDLAEQDWADKYLQAAKLHADIVRELGGVVDVPELQPVAQVPAVEVAQPKKRCAFYREIKAFFACARERGLDISEAARDRMRGAIGILLGRRIESRADLCGSDWELCTNAVRAGRLFW